MTDKPTEEFIVAVAERAGLQVALAEYRDDVLAAARSAAAFQARRGAAPERAVEPAHVFSVPVEEPPA